MLNATISTTLPVPIHTPLLREGDVWLKLEGKQHTGSVKYRMVYAKLRTAIESGVIDSKTILTEISSGSTGIALAYLGRILGLRVEVHTYEYACPEKCLRIAEYGANVVLYPSKMPFTKILEAVNTKVGEGNYWHLNQYDRQSISSAYGALGEEVIEQILEMRGLPPKLFICPVGTGGVIQGVGKCLRRAFPDLQVVAVEPEAGSIIDGMRNTQKTYMGGKDPYDTTFPDQRITVLPPQCNTVVQGIRLGDSATAVYEVIKASKLNDVLLIAPD